VILKFDGVHMKSEFLAVFLSLSLSFATPSATASCFSAPTDFPTNARAYDVAVGDINNDGHLDFITAWSGNICLVAAGATAFLGKGDGTFASQDIGADHDIRGIALADLNHDGKLDLISANYSCLGSATLGVMLGNGDGTFQAEHSIPTDQGVRSLAVGDFNQDGNLDVLVNDASLHNGGFLQLHLGNADGTLRLPVPVPTVSEFDETEDVEIADFNQDGKLDFVVSAGNVLGFAIGLGRGDGTFAMQPRIYSGQVEAGVGDLNGDGKLDLASWTYCPGPPGSVCMRVYLGNGNGTFARGYQSDALALRLGPTALADFGSDGILDLAVLDPDGGRVLLFKGAGDGTFLSPRKFSAGGPVGFRLWRADFNEDGLPDLVTMHLKNGVVVLLNTGQCH
jgi:hypothetical protein